MTHHTCSTKMRRLVRSCTALGMALCLMLTAGCKAAPPAQSTPMTDQTERYEDGINVLMLVNGTHALPDGFDIEITGLANGQQIAEVIRDPLQAMFDDMRAEGIYPVVASGYRTPEKQQSLMDDKVQTFLEKGFSEERAAKEARKWVNPVGYSEHQSGLAVDINADGVHSTGREVYDWLALHAWDYGFILRYPKGKEAITSTSHEPWHYRYVGVEAAQEIRDLGVTLEEYLGEA